MYPLFLTLSGILFSITAYAELMKNVVLIYLFLLFFGVGLTAFYLNLYIDQKINMLKDVTKSKE
jgi:cytochrome c biogenesis factor